VHISIEFEDEAGIFKYFKSSKQSKDHGCHTTEYIACSVIAYIRMINRKCEIEIKLTRMSEHVPRHKEVSLCN
jgi:hypothetical protein